MRLIHAGCWRALLLWLSAAGSAAWAQTTQQPYADLCPEQCGAVLKDCLDEVHDRHVCMERADQCLTGCRAALSGRAEDSSKATAQ